MASLLCVSPSFPPPTVPKPSSRLNLQQKPNSASFSSPRSRARHQESQKSVLPFFSPTHQLQTQLSSRHSTIATKATPSTPVTPTDQEKCIEHIVFFVLKDPPNKDDPQSKRNKKEMEDRLIRALNSLRTLPGVRCMTAGYISKIVPASREYNIFLHSRHATQDDLNRFMSHPLKYGFTMTYTEKDYKDYMIIDYVWNHNGPLAHPKLGNAFRCSFFNLKDGWGDIQRYKVLKEVADSFKGCDQQTFGKSYVTPPTYIPEGGTPPPPPNKGYALATLSVFPTLEKLNALGTADAFAQKLTNNLKSELNESSNANVMVVDYEIKEIYGGDRENLWV